MNQAIITILILASSSCFAGTKNIDLGDSSEKLIKIMGKPTEVNELKIKDKIFVTYFYAKPNSSYVIDKKLNIVCELVLGKTRGYCYPCEYGPTAGTCP